MLKAAVPANMSVPIDLVAVLDSFGIGEPVVEVGLGRHGSLRRVGARWHPVVYRPLPGSPRLSARERFTVAHELAHAIIDDRLRLRPVRNSQYWALEAICHDFANRLLIPEHVASEVRAGLSGASSVLSRIERLASLTETSLPASAHRLLEVIDRASAWGIHEISRRPPEPMSYRVQWTAGDKRYGLTTGSHVKTSNPLFSAIQTTSDEVGIHGEQPVDSGVAAFTRRSSNYLVITCWLHGGPAGSSAGSLPCGDNVNASLFE